MPSVDAHGSLLRTAHPSRLLMAIYSDKHTGPFRLVNRDFGAHNILVEDNYSIVGIVDFDSVAPILIPRCHKQQH